VTAADVVIGDDDGVLFISAARADEIVALAETIRDTERRQADQIRSGTSLRSQLQFAAYLTARADDPTLTFRAHLRAQNAAIED
jgi:regulator of RNase E activity RraA